MQIYREMSAIPAGLGLSVVTVGNFDGVHCGHLAVLDRVRERAADRNARSIVVTFSPHPVQVLRPQLDLKLITPEDDKLRLLGETGVDAAVVLPFTHAFAQMTALQFAEIILRDTLRAVEVYEGENFHFGRGAAGTLASLKDMGRELGFSAFAFAPVMRGGEAISSSRIRGEIAAGRVSAARHLLGRVFSVRGDTAAGRGVGREATVPTLNLSAYAELLPGNGVYVTEVVLDGETMRAVTNIGVRPTFGDLGLAVESFVLDRRLDAVTAGTPLEVRFLRRLRGERKFDSPELLREQILRDVARARKYFQLRERLR